MEATRTKRSATRSRTFRTFATLDEQEERDVCARIKQARKEKGLTQQEMADLLNVEKRTYQNYEDYRVPYKLLDKIAKLVAKPPEWLLYGDGPEYLNRMARVEERLEQMSSQLDRLLKQMRATAVTGAVRRAGESDRKSARKSPPKRGAKESRSQPDS